LVGSWTIERTLLDRSSNQQGSFTGTLEVSPDAWGYRWHEGGTLVWDGRGLTAHRSLALRRLDGRWWMTFADGRPFHPWTIGTRVVHPCAADTYAGRIDRPSESQLRITWDVTGPTKNQLITSWFERT
jgi:hypothetical protein